MSMERGTGGNRFISADSDPTMLVAAIERGLSELQQYAEDTGRRMDVGAITVSTQRISTGAISVTVMGDLADDPDQQGIAASERRAAS